MPNKSTIIVITALSVTAGPLGAQDGGPCSGPGAVFGVTSYQCASCAIEQGAGLRTQYVFQAEPIVLEVLPASVLRPGDVIVAVNGEPIMSQAGAHQFTYPEPGKSALTVRRGNARIELSATTAACRAQAPGREPSADPLVVVDGVIVSGVDQVAREEIESVEVLKGPLATSLYRTDANRTVVAITTKRGAANRQKPVPPVRPDTGPLIIIDGEVVTNTPDIAQVSGSESRFGFAIGCLPSCSTARARDGTRYFKFDGYPAIVAVVPGGVADRSGIRVGDVVTQIDGKSILGEDGALRYLRGNRKDDMHVTVLRERVVLSYLLRAR